MQSKESKETIESKSERGTLHLFLLLIHTIWLQGASQTSSLSVRFIYRTKCLGTFCLTEVTPFEDNAFVRSVGT